MGCPIGFKSYEYVVQEHEERIAIPQKKTKTTASKKRVFPKKNVQQEFIDAGTVAFSRDSRVINLKY